jgi:hypothetical protein
MQRSRNCTAILDSFTMTALLNAVLTKPQRVRSHS